MAAEVILFPDTEALLVDYLTGALPARGFPVPVAVSIPVTRPTAFVVVPRRGGTRRNLVTDQATIGVECYAKTAQAAHDLARMTRGLIHALRGKVVGGVVVQRVQEYAGPANLPDTVSTHSRYVFTVALDVRGTAV